MHALERGFIFADWQLSAKSLWPQMFCNPKEIWPTI